MLLTVYSYEEVATTNEEARKIASQPDAPDAFCVVAASQAKGLGRRGREWASPRGGLWMTVSFPLRRALECYAGVSLAAGWAAAQAVESLVPVEAAIKWPNDLLLGDRKFGGVLSFTEVRGGRPRIYFGIGINANVGRRDLPEDARWDCTSLLAETGHSVDLDALRDRVAEYCAEALSEFDEGRGARVIAEVEERLAWRGQMVAWTDSETGQSCEGRLEGLGKAGELLLLRDGVLDAKHAGDVERLQRIES